MKISKATRWILTIGILAILLTALGIVYNRQMTEQNQLNQNIAQAKQDLVKYTPLKDAAEKKNLETRLSKAKSRIASVQDEFRHYAQSIEINEILFEAAKETNVIITGLSSSVPKEEELNGITYKVFSPITLTGEGGVVDLLRFSEKISQTFSAGNIESVSINVPPKTEEGKEKATINLKLKIYAYEG